MAENISGAVSPCQQPSYLRRASASISLAYMGSPRRNISQADREAADRLKAIWLAMPDRPTQQELAEAWAGNKEANQSLISQYMGGKIALNYRAVLFFAKQLGCEPEDIRDDLPEQAGARPGEPSWDDVKGFAQAVGLGAGSEAQDYAETHKLKFKSSSLARKRLRHDALAVFYGQGDSMEPRIHSGDAILFDTSDTTPRDGALFVVQVHGDRSEYQVKRCEILDDIVYFKADNPSGDHSWRKPRRMDAKRAPIQIVGRVRWIGSWED